MTQGVPARTRYLGDETATQIWWFVNGSLVDYSSGYTFTGKLAAVSSPATVIFTKTTGFTGAAGSGTETSGTPNLTVAWATSGELNTSTLSSVAYLLEIVALKTSDQSQETYQMVFNMRARLG
jgi:hypothetical protein